MRNKTRLKELLRQRLTLKRKCEKIYGIPYEPVEFMFVKADQAEVIHNQDKTGTRNLVERQITIEPFWPLGE